MKRILFCLLLAPLVVMLAACAAEPEPEPQEETPAAAQPQEPTRTIVNVTGDLYKAQNNNHSTAFLVTEEGIIMSDPINRDFADWLKSEMDQRFGVPVRYVLYSHSDWDHASGGEAFADTAEFIGHENMPQALALPGPDTPLPANSQGMDADGNGRIELSEASGNFQNNFALFDADGDGALSGAEVVRGPLNDVHPPTMTYSDRHTVTLGGKSVEMIHPGPAHSANMSVVRFVDEDAIFVVDFISLKRLPFQTIAGYDLDVWLGEMRDVEALGAAIVIPGHGEVGTTADVAEHRQYIEELRDAVAAGIAAGATLPELQETIRMEGYEDWANYDQWRVLNIEGMYNILNS